MKLSSAKAQQNWSLPVNFAWLTSSQCVNIFIPLLIYPYLLRIVGIENFGSIIFAQAIAIFLSTIVDYGFSISAVSDVSRSRADKRALSIIFSEVLSLRIVIFLLITTLFTAALYLFTLSNEVRILLLFSLSIVAGQMIIPIWFFQGMEKMKGIAVMNFAAKGLFVFMILLFVREETGYFYVNLFLGLSYIIVGTVAVLFIYYHFKLSFSLVPDLSGNIRKNKELLLSQLSTYVSGNSTMIIVGLLADPMSVGYYAVVEKILLAGRAPAVLLYQVIFPKVSLLSERSRLALEKFLAGVMKLIFLTFVPLGIILFFFSGYVVYLFTGQMQEEISVLIRVVSIVPLMAAVNIPATQTLLAYNFRDTYMKVTTVTAILCILTGFILIDSYGALGAVITVVFIEVSATVLLFGSLSLIHRDYSMLKLFKPVWT